MKLREEAHANVTVHRNEVAPLRWELILRLGWAAVAVDHRHGRENGLAVSRCVGPYFNRHLNRLAQNVGLVQAGVTLSSPRNLPRHGRAQRDSASLNWQKRR